MMRFLLVCGLFACVLLGAARVEVYIYSDRISNRLQRSSILLASHVVLCRVECRQVARSQPHTYPQPFRRISTSSM